MQSQPATHNSTMGLDQNKNLQRNHFVAYLDIIEFKQKIKYNCGVVFHPTALNTSWIHVHRYTNKQDYL